MITEAPARPRSILPPRTGDNVIRTIHLSLALGLCATLASAQQRYSIRLILPLPGHAGSVASGIDDHARVVGTSDTDSGYLWELGRTRALQDHGGGTRSRAEGIGPGGLVLGAARSGAFDHATLWFSQDSDDDHHHGDYDALPIIDLGTAGKDVQSIAEAANARGFIVGCSDDGLLYAPAVFEPTPDGTRVTRLPLPLGQFSGVARDINSVSIVAGFSAGFGHAQAAIWRPVAGGWAHDDLEALHPGHASEAVGINEQGTIAGHAVSRRGYWHLVVWHAGVVRDLGAPPRGQAFARAIGDGGAIVGYTIGADLVRRAVLYSPPDDPANNDTGSSDSQKGLVELHGLLPPGNPWSELREATDINAGGQIVGYGVIGGFLQSYIATPVRRRLEVPSNLDSGSLETVTIHGAAPGSRIELYSARGGGETLVEGLVQSLDLDCAHLLQTQIAGPRGMAVFSLSLSPGSAGHTVWLQALDRSSGEVSDVIERQIL